VRRCHEVSFPIAGAEPNAGARIFLAPTAGAAFLPYRAPANKGSLVQNRDRKGARVGFRTRACANERRRRSLTLAVLNRGTIECIAARL
jgi:hypothetical protein